MDSKLLGDVAMLTLEFIQKFGPSKQEVQALKQQLAARKSFDSEPPTPKSVRPPLSSVTEAELKAACTWVVANYRPSHIPWVESPGIGVSHQIQHVDYAVLNAALRGEMGGEAPMGAQWPPMSSDEMRVEQDGNRWPSSDLFRFKATDTSKDLFQNDDFEAMRAQRSSIMEKADELMSNLEETQKVLLSPERRSYARTTSSQSAISLPIQGAALEPKAKPRSDSVGTVTSTPRTNITGSAGFGSTAATSAYVTPAAQSKRTSHTQSDSHLPPKVTAVDAEWMRQELEKHLKAQEEYLTRKESPVQEVAAGLAETTPTPIAQTPASPTSIRRKPVPRRGTGESQQNFSLRSDSRQSKPHSRTVSRPDTMPTSPMNAQMQERPSTSGRASTNDSKRLSRVRSITRDFQNFVRPSTAIKAKESDDRPRSRAQSTKSHVQNFSRPSLDATRSKVSLDISGPPSRGRSVDSFRSAVSAISSSVETSAKQWRGSMARRKSRDSDVSMETRSARTSESGRGRPRMPRHSPPPPPRPKVNLNRELPPLPGLDQWKPVQVETAYPGALDLADAENDNEAIPDPRAEYNAFPRRQDSLVNRRPPTQRAHQPTASTATFQTCQARQSVHVDADTTEDNDEESARATTTDPSTSSAQSRGRYSRSKPVVEGASPDFVYSMSQVSLGRVSTEQGPPTRQWNSTPYVALDTKRHSRNISGSAVEAPNFSRKLSSDEYNRMYDSRYANMLEVTPSVSHGSGSSGGKNAPPVPPKDKKSKRHWWKGKPKREETWMDAVVKSGSRSGVLLTDEVAGAPIVRY